MASRCNKQLRLAAQLVTSLLCKYNFEHNRYSVIEDHYFNRTLTVYFCSIGNWIYSNRTVCLVHMKFNDTSS